ncbi:hypothetical protein BC938DRAFT_476208 [Jimgerdemannia flammicorona]|uniref:Uncharacterized protein n=1 Tax=Jimgerdemannia flammicorona TaxID=994334 RepID=A0A433PJ76_9FUNG|nr:hypothetical protein BC938DRAFT_476208 [Jimgerdemannia flammicorona]
MPIGMWTETKFRFGCVHDFTQHLLAKANSDQADVNTAPSDSNLEPRMTDSTKFIDDVAEVQIKSRMFQNMNNRMAKKAGKVSKSLKKLSPDTYHLVLYDSTKTGGSTTIVPSIKTKRRVSSIGSSRFWLVCYSIDTLISVKQIIFAAAASRRVRLLYGEFEGLFVTGPIAASGGSRMLTEEEQTFAEMLKHQVVYGVAAELLTIYARIGNNSSLSDLKVPI